MSQRPLQPPQGMLHQHVQGSRVLCCILSCSQMLCCMLRCRPPLALSASRVAGRQYTFVSEALESPADWTAALLTSAAGLRTCMAPGGSQLPSEPEVAAESLSASQNSCMACGAALHPHCWLPSAPVGKSLKPASTISAVPHGLRRLMRPISAPAAPAEKMVWQHGLPWSACAQA